MVVPGSNTTGLGFDPRHALKTILKIYFQILKPHILDSKNNKNMGSCI